MPVVAWGIVVLGDVAAVAVALLGLALIAGMLPLAQLTESLAAKLFWPFSLLVGVVGRLVQAAIADTVSWSQASGDMLASAISEPWRAVWTVQRQVVESTEHLYWAVYRVEFTTVPNVVRWADGAIGAAYAAAVAHADQLGQLLARYAQGLVAQAMARADQEFQEAVAHADQLAAAEGAYAQALGAQVLARAQLEVQQALEFTQAGVATAEGYAQALALEGIAYTDRAVLGAEDYARGVGADAEAYARALQQQALDFASAEAGAVAAAAAAATAVVAQGLQAVEDSPCMRTCDQLGGLGQMLQGLEGDGVLALLLALVAEAESDPQGLQTALRGAVVGPVQDALGMLGFRDAAA